MPVSGGSPPDCQPAEPGRGRPEMCVAPPSARVGAMASLVFSWRLPEAGLPAGGALQLELPSAYQGKLADFLLTTPQTADPTAPGFLEGCLVEAASPDGPCRSGGEALDVEVADRIVTLQATRRVAASRVGLRFATRIRKNAGSIRWKFRSDLDGDGRFDPSDEPGYFEGPRSVFVPEKPAYVVLSAPADVAVGEAFTLQLVAHDRFANAAAPGELTVTLEGASGLPAQVSFRDGPSQALPGLRHERAGFAKIQGRSDAGLPVHTHYSFVHERAPTLRRYFGDLQFHTGTITTHAWNSFVGGDHRGQYTEARQAWEYARDVARLDFAALTEHDLGSTRRGWLAAGGLAAEFDVPGEFTAFRAYEWTPTDWATRGRAAHQVVLYRADAGEIFGWDPERASEAPYADLVQRLEQQRAELERAGRDAEFLLIPHPMGSQDLVAGGRHPIFAPGAFDERVAPVAEFHSRHVSRSQIVPWHPEMFVVGPDATHALQYAWGRRGLHVGVVGSSDNHVQMPGVGSRAVLRRHAGSLAVALAGENSRQALWNALRARRSYGTTGTRIYVDLRCNGHTMGERARAGGPRRFAIRVGATAPLAEVSLVRFRGEAGWERILHVTDFPESDRYQNDTFLDATPLGDGEVVYYLRVLERNLETPGGKRIPGHFALTSPIWISR